ncbi:hypothetical protein T310_0674 [Rasamsonia emersonii CBS 393.64]|uniref:Uncharacterized protein n=1 Tax=Rasamsonia emersonii (strain ATCC 16479 / CBS 393.64 / IMI 116815) TaxID=1408163 RepID=A0A0F4Z4Q2_RASE3|nr:hypothetical protein T310_0674 [Rasamsonia emersonii CBS 393.64]KKA25300.1 hypothetical protein T310_0674 [Rasamsonia emersonii CBS 393.64]
MKPLGEHQERKQVWRSARAHVASHDRGQSKDIERRKQDLAEGNIATLIRHAMQEGVYVDVGSRVDEGARGPLDGGIITFAGMVERDLLHIRCPIDLCVCCSDRSLSLVVHELEGNNKRTSMQELNWVCMEYGVILTRDLPDDEAAEDRIRKDEQRRDPSCMLRVPAKVGYQLIQIHCCDLDMIIPYNAVYQQGGLSSNFSSLQAGGSGRRLGQHLQLNRVIVTAQDFGEGGFYLVVI